VKEQEHYHRNGEKNRSKTPNIYFHHPVHLITPFEISSHFSLLHFGCQAGVRCNLTMNYNGLHPKHPITGMWILSTISHMVLKNGHTA
jgi:hypothetical protein